MTTSTVAHDYSLGDIGNTAYGRGCRCQPCRGVKAAELATWQARRPKFRKQGGWRRLSNSSATECICGGLLAETSDGRVFCLRCEPDLA